MPGRSLSIVTTKMGLPLRVLTETMDGSWASAPPQTVSSVRIDSRNCEPESLFVALAGSNADGHDYLDDAEKRGASAAIVERKQPSGLPQFVVENSTDSLQQLAVRYRRRCVDAYVIGITGTCGKTTLKTMLADVLESEYRVGRTPGNYNNHLGVPLTLLNEGGGDVLVAEVATNAPGEIGQLSRWLKPDMGIITHVGPAHLEGLETVEKVAREKADLLAELAEDGIALLPGWIRHRDTIVARSRVLPRSIERGNNGSFRIDWTDNGNSSVITVNDTTVELGFGGEGLLRDAVLAVVAGTLMGVAPEAMKSSLESFEPLPGRGQTTTIDQTVLIDGTYNANPDSMRGALDRLAGQPAPRLAVLGDMKELGETSEPKHRELAKYASTMDEIDLVFVGSNEEYFRSGLDDFAGEYIGVAAVGSVPDLDPSEYGSVLVKASRAVELDTLVDNWTDST